jgi:hypothetical protein
LIKQRRHGRTHLVSTNPRRPRYHACGRHAIGGDSSFRVPADETLTDVIAEYVAAQGRSNQLAARFNLDHIAQHHIVGPVSLRFIYLGMIAETARHAGHADILAEEIQARQQ